MSQVFFVNAAIEPTVPTSFVTDDGTAVPLANVLNIVSDSTADNDANGIFTLGSGNTVTIELTNRFNNVLDTVGNVTSNILTIPLGAVPGTFSFEFRLAAFESTTPAGASYLLFCGVRTDGVNAVLLGNPIRSAIKEAALDLSQVSVGVAGNNFLLRVTGVAGLTIHWSVVGLYTQSP